MVPGHTGDGGGHQEAWGTVAEEQMVLKPSTSTPSPGISPQVPVGLPGTCGRTLPAAPSPAHVLSGALQGGHEPSVTGVRTLGQRVPPEPPSAMERGAASPRTHMKPEGHWHWWGEPCCPSTHLAGSLCALSSGHQTAPPGLFPFPPGKQGDDKPYTSDPALRDALALPTPSDSLPDPLQAS